MSAHIDRHRASQPPSTQHSPQQQQQLPLFEAVTVKEEEASPRRTTRHSGLQVLELAPF